MQFPISSFSLKNQSFEIENSVGKERDSHFDEKGTNQCKQCRLKIIERVRDDLISRWSERNK